MITGCHAPNVPLIWAIASGLMRRAEQPVMARNAIRESAPAATALLDLCTGGVGDVACPFAGRLRQFGGPLPRNVGPLRTPFSCQLGELCAALTGRLGQHGCAFAGDFG